MTDTALIDNSAWSRLPSLRDRLPDEAERLAGAFERGNMMVCLPFLLEAGFSARNADEHQQLFEALLALPQAPIDEAVEQRARHAQRQLADTGHHRLPPVDVLIAATADRYGVGIVHYDADYDLIREHTDLEYESRWVAPRGTW